MPGYTSDIMLQRLVESFIQQHDLEHLQSENQIFEHFVNYCIVSRYISDRFNLDDVTVGRRDFIHGIAIVVNERLVSSIDQIDDLTRKTNRLDIDFIFIQARNINQFGNKAISRLCNAVVQFFSSKPALRWGRRADKLLELKDYIYRNQLYDNLPTCHLYYVAPGVLQNDSNLRGIRQTATSSIKNLSQYDFRDVEFHLIDSRKLRNIYRGLRNRVVKTIEFAEFAPLPRLADVQAAQTGILSCTEFLKLITDEDGLMQRNLFNEKVRDYQGNNNPVNKEIAETIRTQSKHDKFVLLNNGVTIVAKLIEQIGKEFTLTDYEIVNGCQTSHVLYLNREHLSDNIYLPVKIVATTAPEISSLIIESTNSQTPLAASASLTGPISKVKTSIEDMSSFDRTTEANRDTGIVSRIVPAKNYALIQSDRGDEVYVPLGKGKTKLEKGQKVEFTIVPPPKEWKRPEARNVKVLE